MAKVGLCALKWMFFFFAFESKQACALPGMFCNFVFCFCFLFVLFIFSGGLQRQTIPANTCQGLGRFDFRGLAASDTPCKTTAAAMLIILYVCSLFLTRQIRSLLTLLLLLLLQLLFFVLVSSLYMYFLQENSTTILCISPLAWIKGLVVFFRKQGPAREN